MTNPDETKADAINDRLKSIYGLDNLCFYFKKGMYHCKYSKTCSETEMDYCDLDFLLKALNIQQAIVHFDDVGHDCIGMDELKKEYLVFRLSGL